MKTASRPWIVALCWLTVAFEGFDIVALGATIPVLTDPAHGVGVTAAEMTFVATISLVGVGAGATAIGPLADRFGRRGPLMACILVFSIFTLVFPLMPNAAMMGAVRFIAGLGLGGCMPVAVTMMQESAPGGRKAHASTITMTGYHAGAVLASLGALWLGGNWHWLFYLGGLIGLALVPVMWAKLPETHPLANAEAAPGPRYGVRDLFTSGRGRITIGLWVGTFMGLLLVYGLNTWLPKIMAEAGYPMSNSLVMLFVMNVGAIIGLLVGGRIGDAKGVKGTILIWFGASAVLLSVLSIPFTNELLLDAVLMATGVFVFSAQVLIYGLVGYVYPKALTATGMGFTSGVGRLGAIVGPLISGVLVTAGIAYPAGFYMFAAAAVIAFVAVLSIPKPKASTAAALAAQESQESARA
ncbi:MFS transporter [Microbacterium halophytorum]|uniref:MFS transporter n=1 Tax=Microbacterium halophytorum TaxID=2067568 RepID=UPI000CFD324F|nr:aromatic acid/H+ symport family MFS transporter [Microbacterium halophytorum]